MNNYFSNFAVCYMKRKIIFVALLLLVNCSLFAQYYSIGSDPASVKWMQIKSNHYNILYPQEMDSLARRYLYLFEKNRSNTEKGLLIETPKVPLIIRPYSTQSNATVVWAPKRVELITTPPATGGYAQNWEKQLVLHEGRHVSQMQHYTKKTFKVFNFLLGEQSIALGVGIYPSAWIMEGDATIHETDMSNSGRGRSGSFLMYYRAAFIEGDTRSYDKWRYGSYHYYTPNKYAFGYMMLSDTRYFTDDYYSTGKIFDRIVSNWWNFFSGWNVGFQQATGKTARKNWRYMTSFMVDMWTKDFQRRAPYSPFNYLLADNDHLYTSYTNLLPWENGSTISLRSGYEHARALVEIDSMGQTHQIRPFSSTTSDLVPTGDGTIVWAETVPDVRWDLKTSSIIRSYDIKTHKMRDITHNTRYFNPTLSPSNDSILVAEYILEGGSNLVVLDRASGDAVFKKAAPNHGQVLKGVLIGNISYTSVITEKGLGLYAIDISDPENEWYLEIPEQNCYIQNMKAYRDQLYFVSDLDGLNNAYTYNPRTKFLQKLTNSRYGATNPIINESTGELYYSDYSTIGYHPVKTSLDSLEWSPASFDKPFKHPVAEQLALQAKQNTTPITEEEDEAFKTLADTIKAYPYKRFTHLINIHSWAPFYANIDRIMTMSYDHYYQLVSLGATVISQNTLGNATAQLGYSYHKGFHSGHLNFNYSGFYPIFELAVDYNDRNRQITTIDKAVAETNDGIQKYPITYHIDTTSTPALDASLKVYVPLNFSKSGWHRGLVPQVTLNFSNDQLSVYGSPFKYRHSLTYGVRFYSMLSETRTALFPRWGLGVDLQGTSSFGNHNELGNLIYTYVYGYLPGLTRQQGLKLTASYQKQFSKEYFGFIPNAASMPRGYTNHILSDYTKFTVDYAIPIYLGDVSWPWLFFLKRLQVIPFVDVAIERDKSYPFNGDIIPNPKQPYYSHGVDVILSAHIIRIGSELSFGFRYARTADNRNYWNVLFRTGL